MSLRINSYQAALEFISLHPAKSLVATADGGLRTKSFADSLKSFGSFFVGGYRKNLEARDAAVAHVLQTLYEQAESGSSTPHSIPGFERYFQAKLNLQDRLIAASRPKNQVSKSSLRTLAGAKKVSLKELGKRIFDTKPISYQLDLGKTKTQEILHTIQSLAEESDKVGGTLDDKTGLADQYITDVLRQDNFFTSIDGQTKQATSQEDAVSSLKELADNPEAAKALSCIANQASVLTLLTTVSKSLNDEEFITPLVFNDHASQEHRLTKLANGNTQYQFNFYAPINGISSESGKFLETERWSKPYNANESEHDLRLSLTIELDASALREGKLVVVKHQPIAFDINIKPVSA